MSAMTIQQLLAGAVQAYRQGHRQQAEAMLRQVLARQGDHAEALHLFGVIAHETGRNGEAVGAISRAIARRPDVADYHNNLGMALAALGRNNEAVAAFRRAVGLRPDEARFHNNLGIALCASGASEEGIASYRRALELQPEYHVARYNLGNAIFDSGDFAAAAEEHRAAITGAPSMAAAHGGLGRALSRLDDMEGSIAAYRRALELEPENTTFHNNLGNVFCRIGRVSEGLAEHELALAHRPGDVRFLNNYANALCAVGQIDQSIAVYRQALAAQPDSAEAHWNLGCTLLLKGDYAEGWREYEWRWRVKELHLSPRVFSQPRWDGSALSGVRILLHAEQGLGDAIHFVRYVPLIAEMGGRVILECRSELRRLMSGLAGVSRLIGPKEDPGDFDVQCPLLSIPLVMGTTPATIPAEVPYIRAERSLVEKWRSRIESVGGGGRRVGLAWSGSAEFRFNADRSMALKTLAPLAEVEGITFYSLQKGPPARQAKSPPTGMRLIDWSEELEDMAETAALMANLDLVISVDTSVPHLAGAVGRPVWLMTQYVPDWRWLMGRDDTPWYPTMRLFRQTQIGDWNDPVARAALAARALT